MKQYLLYILFLFTCSLANANNVSGNISYAENQHEKIGNYVNSLDFISDEFIDDNQDDESSKHLILYKIVSNNQLSSSASKKNQYSKTKASKLFLLNQYLDLPPPGI